MGPFFLSVALLLGIQHSPEALLTSAEELVQQPKAAIGPSPVVVRQGSDLQAALKAGAVVHLQSGTTYPGNFVLKSGTTLDCQGASIVGSKAGPALDIPPGTNDVTVKDCSVTTTYDQSVIRIGRNDTKQATLEGVPRRITFTRVFVPTYRGKRGFEISGADVTLQDCRVDDLWDPALRDSQAISVTGNSPGPVLVDGGSYSGGSETLMVGGDPPKIPGVIPSHVTVQNATFGHPLSWQHDGTKRAIKNILELKTGHHIIFRKLHLSGLWVDAQPGWAVVMTPRAGGEIADVLIEDVVMENVAGGFNVLGSTSNPPPSPHVTSGVLLNRVTVTTNKATFGGTGWFAQLGAGVHDFTVQDSTFVGDGTAFIATYQGAPLDPVTGVSTPAAPMETLSVTNSKFTAGIYGFFLNGLANANPTQKAVKALTVTGNTITGASAALKTALPQNTFN